MNNFFEFNEPECSKSHIDLDTDEEETTKPFPDSSSSESADDCFGDVPIGQAEDDIQEDSTLCAFCGASDFSSYKEHLLNCEFYDNSIAGVIGKNVVDKTESTNDDYYKLCIFCNEYFLYNEYSDHMKDEHDTTKSPDFIFNSWEYIDPMKTFDSLAVLCASCGHDGFKSPLEYIDHINAHGDFCQEVYVCQCGYESFFHNEIFDHIVKVLGGKCDMSLIGWPTYALEFKDKYKIVVKDLTDRKFKCMYCDYTAPKSKDINVHTSNIHLKKNITCNYAQCNDKFATEQDLRHHRNTKHVQSVYCITCRSSFTKDEYLVHQYRCDMDKAIDTCPLCNKEIAIQSLLDHFNDPEHLKIEKTFINGLVYDKKIPCFVCSKKAIVCFPDIVTLLKHYCTKHRLLYKNVLQHLSSVKKGVSFRAKARPKAKIALREMAEEENVLFYDNEDIDGNQPFTIQEMEQYSEKEVHKAGTSRDDYVEIHSPNSVVTIDDSPNSVECIIKIESDTDDEQELMECFLCHVQTIRSPNYLRTHFDEMAEEHEERINQWKAKFHINHIPCPECDTKAITTIQEGFAHYELTHGFDILQLYDHIAKYKPKYHNAGGNFPKLVHPCVFCGTPLAPLASKIKYHFYKIQNISHKLNLEKWKELNGFQGFPCNYCGRDSHTIISALQHCESDHNGNVTDYYSFMSDMIPETLKETRKSCYLCKEKFPTVWVDIKYHFTKSNHLVQSNNWKAANYLNSFPCGLCNIQSLKSIADGIHHYCDVHNLTADEYYDYFVFYSEELRMNALAAIEGGESTSNYIPMRDGKVAISKLRRKRKAED